MENPPGLIEAGPQHNAIVADLLSTNTTLPDIEPVPQDEVTLPSGLILRDGSIATDAIVRELTGKDEEALARARTSTNPVRLIATLVECGTKTIGGITPTRDQILGLLAGDWLALIIGIRRATYGTTLDYAEVTCPHCGGLSDITIDLDQIPNKNTIDTVAGRQFTLDLRHGRKAQVAFPTGRDQDAVYEKPGLSMAERNTLTLTRCVQKIVEADGTIVDISLNSLYVRDVLSIADRRTIIDALMEREPGPRLEELSFQHDACGQEVATPLQVADLFRDL